MKSLLYAFATFCAFSWAVADDYPKNESIDALHYSFSITLSDSSDEIVGRTTMDILFKKAGVSEVRLDLVEVDEANDGKGMRVLAVYVAGKILQWRHEHDALFITLDRPSTADQRIQIEVQYRGVPAAGLVIGNNKYGDRTFFTGNWPNKARHWLPTIDHPYDKATCEFLVNAPNHYQVVSNGLLVEESDLSGNRRLTHWKHSVPIATWLYVIGVARFAVQHVDDFQGKPIQTWVYYQDRDAGFYDFAVPTKQVLAFYSDYVGPYSYEKMANIQSNSVGGGMEAATAVFYGDNSVTGDRSVRWRNVIIHEIAHHWFGNAVTEYDWDDVWLSEGFATYFTLLFIEHAYGHDAFMDGLMAAKDRVQRFHDENPDYRIVHDNLVDMNQVTTSQTYQKGAWVLHMLRGIIGDEAFREGIQAYYAEFQDRNATTRDFRRHMERVSGLDLSRFFEQWLHQGGELKLKGAWMYDSASSTVKIELNQVQPGDYLFEMPVSVDLYFSGSPQPERHLLHVSDRQNRIEIPVPSRPEKLILDPENWVLMNAEATEKTLE